LSGLLPRHREKIVKYETEVLASIIIFSSYSLALILMLARHDGFTDEELDFIPTA